MKATSTSQKAVEHWGSGGVCAHGPYTQKAANKSMTAASSTRAALEFNWKSQLIPVAKQAQLSAMQQKAKRGRVDARCQ